MARLATADGSGAPHAIPICYAFDGRNIYSAIDLKPKRVGASRLKRVRNIDVNPSVALVIDDYDEDWNQLAYVLIQGRAHILQDDVEQQRAESLLRDKYPQYQTLLEPGCVVIRITPERVIAWGSI